MARKKEATRERGVMPGRGLSGKALGRWPGDLLRELTAPAEDESGRVWPVGTQYTPLSGGADQRGPRCDGTYQDVTISGQRVTFRFGGVCS